MPRQDLTGLELDDRFRLGEQVGEGGMGAVYEAEDLTLPRRVAVKVLPAEDADSDLKRRFKLEMDAAASIEHRSIVPVFAAGFDQGFLYIAMRFVDGPDLKELLEGGPLELERALRILGDVASALRRMHAAHYVHRDVKPANILVAEAGTSGEYALLADMGIVRALDDPAGVTHGMPPGTPLYMAPETFQHWVAEAPADQYALACVLFEMLAGRPPFESDERFEIERMHVSVPAPSLAEFAPEAPEEVCQAVSRALEKDPTDRFADIADFAAAVFGETPEQAAEREEHAGEEGPPERRLTPAAVSSDLFGISPDRDERASQLAMETLLTLWSNGYAPPEGQPESPKRRNGALRALAIGENFLKGFEDQALPGLTIEEMGDRLASGHDFAGSDGLALAQDALRALIDERTLQGSAGATLMLPFHESLLWYDSRQSGAARPWAIRKVNMRGTGLTLGRMLLAPPTGVDETTRSDAQAAVEGIKEALQAPSPFSGLASRLQVAAPDSIERRDLEPDESAAWEAAERPSLARLAERVVRHSAAITRRPGVAASSKLMAVRSILALDIAHHALERSWEAIGTPGAQRYLLLTYTPEVRRRNRVRIASEASYQAARQSIAQAMINTLAASAARLAEGDGTVDWDVQFERRSGLDAIAEQLADADEPDEFTRLAGLAFEESRGAGYSRPVDAFRVLLESVDLLIGTGQYRFLRAEPELLEALAGAVGGTPMPTGDFLARLWEEWRIVVGEGEIAGTALGETLDGSLLARNARFMEQLMVDAGLAVALSDQTCMVGQRGEAGA